MTRKRAKTKLGQLGPNEGVITSPETRANRLKWLFLGTAGLLGVGLLIFKRKAVATMATNVVASGKELAFQLALQATAGGNYARYAFPVLTAARNANVNPWLLLGIMARESNAGAALKPADAGGTGDFKARPAGRKYLQPSGKYYTVGATGQPEDSLGWGRGLMQVDYGVHNEWVMTHDWRDAVVNVERSAELLAANLRFFASLPGGAVSIECWRLERGMPEYNIQPWRTKYPNAQLPACAPAAPTGTRAGAYKDPRPLAGQALEDAALAAYNAGTSGVLQAIAAGLPAEAPTSTQSYVTWLRNRISPWLAKFS